MMELIETSSNDYIKHMLVVIHNNIDVFRLLTNRMVEMGLLFICSITKIKIVFSIQQTSAPFDREAFLYNV